MSGGYLLVERSASLTGFWDRRVAGRARATVSPARGRPAALVGIRLREALFGTFGALAARDGELARMSVLLRVRGAALAGIRLREEPFGGALGARAARAGELAK